MTAAPVRLRAFTLTETLGRGGMATVYAAEHVSGRTVAVKVVDPGGPGRPGFVDFFAQEVAAVATLGHPNIIRVFDQGTTPPDLPLGIATGAPWMAMEYWAVGGLGSLPDSVTWPALRPVFEALLRD